MNEQRPYRHKFLNTVVDNLDCKSVCECVVRAIQERSSLRIFFVNALKVHEVKLNAAVGEAMEASELVLADGMPVVWASRLFQQPLAERLSGTDMFTVLLHLAAEQGYKVFFLGATADRLEKMLSEVLKRWPSLRIVGARNGYFNEADDDTIIKEINQSEADMLFLGFSSPKKELWTQKHRLALQVPVIQGVGGSFDVLAGAIPRAPRWMQAAGLEWSFRLIQEPRRMFKRYMVTNTYFITQVLRHLYLRMSP